MAEIDDDTLELIERRLRERVEQNVRDRLFKSYFAMGAAVAAVLGWVGYSFIADAKERAETTIQNSITGSQKKIDDFQQKTISDYASYFDGKKKELDAFSNTIRVSQGKLEWISDQVNDKVRKINDVAESTGPEISDLKKSSQAIQDDLATLKQSSQTIEDSLSQAKEVGQNVRADVARFEDLPSHLAQLTKDVETLTLNVGKLASAAKEGPEQTAISSSAAQTAVSVKATLANIESDKSRPVVFLQYSGMPKETAEAIAQELRQQNLTLPGIDNEPMKMGLRSVRYYYPNDLNSANNIAQLAEQALVDAKLPPGNVKVEDYSGYKGTKPRQGTLELWLGE